MWASGCCCSSSSCRRRRRLRRRPRRGRRRDDHGDGRGTASRSCRGPRSRRRPRSSADDLTAEPRRRAGSRTAARSGTSATRRSTRSTPSNVARPQGRLADAPATAPASPRSTRARRSRSSTTASIYVPTGDDDVFAVDVDDRQDPLAVQGAPRPEDQHRLLRLDEPRRRDRRRQGLPRPARRQARRARPEDRAKSSGRRRSAAGRTGYTITSAPLYYDGLVITGVSGGEFGIRGRVTASTRRPASRSGASTRSPAPARSGHDTWPQDNDAWKHGGAPVWQTPAVDPELGLLYFSTGNAGPDSTAASRAGDNLFAASIVALDAKTGKYRWHFQQVHHDIWDYDAPEPGRALRWRSTAQRKGSAQAGKTGWLYLLDRETGKPLYRSTRSRCRSSARRRPRRRSRSRATAVHPARADGGGRSRRSRSSRQAREGGAARVSSPSRCTRRSATRR